MFEWDPEGQRWNAMHHPFTAPLATDLDALAEKPSPAVHKLMIL